MTGTLEYADSHGINVPVIEEPDMGDDGDDGFDETEADSLAAALQAASNSFMDANHRAQGVEANGAEHSALSDSLGLGKLLQESLQGQMAAPGEQGTMGNGDNVFESKGLASLLFEKLSSGYEGDFSANQAQANMVQVANGKLFTSPHVSAHGLTYFNYSSSDVQRPLWRPIQSPTAVLRISTTYATAAGIRSRNCRRLTTNPISTDIRSL